MALSELDVLRFTCKGTHLGQNIVNVLHYEISNINPPYNIIDELTDWFLSYILTARVLQSTAFNHTELRVDNLSNQEDFYVISANTPGTITGQDMPSYVAANFTKVVPTKKTRPGSYRLGGLTEGQVDQNTYQPDSTDADALASFLGTIYNFNANGPNVFNGYPIVCRVTQKEPSVIIVRNYITHVTWSDKISSQVSRKLGHGST